VIRRAVDEEFGVLNILQAQAESPSRGDLMEHARTLSHEVQDRIGVMGQAQVLRLFRAAHNRDLARQKLLKVVVVCGILGPLGALFVHLLITGRLIKRLQAVGENARRLAHGLPLDPLPPGTDEIADLGRQLDHAAYLLRLREQGFRESERRYRELFDQAPIPYKEIDRQGVIRRFNAAACELLRCTPDQVLGRRAWEYLDPEEQEAFRHAMLERMERGVDSGPIECDYVLDDGSRITVEIRENVIRNQYGEPTGVCRSLLDVTERHLSAVAARKVEQYALELRTRNEQLGRALEAARSAAVAKSRFLASVSHELRTPLNGIIGFSELLHDGKLGDISAGQTEVLADILTSARHMLHLINDILDLSKVEAGKMEFRPEECDVVALALEVRDVVRPLADKKRIDLAAEMPPALQASTDPGRLKQILYNYLSNAVKFTPDGGKVTLRVRSDDRSFRLEVEDTGIGIAANDIPELFQEFHQLSTAKRADQGTGLGLALTRRIVEAQGGRVDVRSEVGKGSVFVAVLPLHAASAAASA
jgi:PAS domain S-box-containing protein